MLLALVGLWSSLPLHTKTEEARARGYFIRGDSGLGVLGNALRFPLPSECEDEVGLRTARVPQPVNARVVAIGDVHGDLVNFHRALKAAQLVDERYRWSAGRDILVLTGDLVERGADTKSVLETALRLGREASVVGGKVIQLLGNHEIMTMRGKLKYVHKKDLASFGGTSARAHAFSVDGAWGRRLRCMPAVVVVGRDLFVHAGLLFKWVEGREVDALNADVRNALLSDSFRMPVLGTEGPLWTRLYSGKYAPGHENSPCPALRNVLDT